MSSHAFLSPSASHRWLNCPPSAKLCAALPDQTSPYAAQGTDAHELCAYLVEKALGRDVKDPTNSLSYYDEEMQTCAEGYAEFVMQEYELAKQNCPIAGDDKHGNFKINKLLRKALGVKQLLLAATSLTFPVDGRDKTISIPTPEHFQFQADC